MAFHFLPMPHHVAAQMDLLARGLTLHLVTRMDIEQAVHPRLSVLLHGVEVHTVEMNSFLRGNAFVPMAVRLRDAAALEVDYDGEALVRDLLLDALAPAADWHFAFSATTGFRATCFALIPFTSYCILYPTHCEPLAAPSPK